MPRRTSDSQALPDFLLPQPFDLMNALGHLGEDMAADSAGAMLLAVNSKKTFLQIAHTTAADHQPQHLRH